MAKKPKTFALRVLAKAAHQNHADMPRLLKSLGIKPVEEAAIGGRTYRAYDQTALDTVIAWRAQKDAENAAQVAPDPIPEPTPVELPQNPPFTDAPRAITIALDQNRARDMAEINNGLTYLNRKIDQLLAQVRALNTEMGVGASVLDGVAASLPDDAGRAQ